MLAGWLGGWTGGGTEEHRALGGHSTGSGGASGFTSFYSESRVMAAVFIGKGVWWHEKWDEKAGNKALDPALSIATSLALCFLLCQVQVFSVQPHF